MVQGAWGLKCLRSLELTPRLKDTLVDLVHASPGSKTWQAQSRKRFGRKIVRWLNGSFYWRTCPIPWPGRLLRRLKLLPAGLSLGKPWQALAGLEGRAAVAGAEAHAGASTFQKTSKSCAQVELPRLGLSFRLCDGVLSCEQYGGLKALPRV